MLAIPWTYIDIPLKKYWYSFNISRQAHTDASKRYTVADTLDFNTAVGGFGGRPEPNLSFEQTTSVQPYFNEDDIRPYYDTIEEHNISLESLLGPN